MSHKTQRFAAAEAQLASYLNKIGNDAAKRASLKINDPSKLSLIANAHKAYVTMGHGQKLINRLNKDKKQGLELYFNDVELANFHLDFEKFLKEVREAGETTHNSTGAKVGNWIKSLSAASACSEEEVHYIIYDDEPQVSKSGVNILPASPESSLKIIPNKDSRQIDDDSNDGKIGKPDFAVARPNWVPSDDELERENAADARPKGKASKKPSLEEQKQRNDQEEDLVERLINSVAGHLSGIPLGVRKNVLKRFAGYMGVDVMNHGKKDNVPTQQKEKKTSSIDHNEVKKKTLSRNGQIEHALRAMQEEAKKLKLDKLPQDHPLTKEWMRLREERKSFRGQHESGKGGGINDSGADTERN